MLISATLRILASQVKSLGFYEVSNDLPSREECCAVESKVFEELNQGIDDFWDNVFLTAKHYFLMDKHILYGLRTSSFTWLLRYVFIKICRLIWLLVDLISMITCKHYSFYCSVRSTGNSNSSRVLFLYSKNTARGDVLNDDQNFFQHDLLVSKHINPDYNILCSRKLNFRIKVECLKLKLKFPYCTSDLIFETFVGRTLLLEALRSIAKKSDHNAAFSREAWTPISRIFLAAATEEKINSVVFYTRPIIHEYMYVPRQINTLLLLSKKSSPKYPFDANKQFLEDYPFLPWRHIAMTPFKNNNVGLLMGDEFNRWADQKHLDEKILDVLSGIEGITCIGRPHPQEMTRPHRVTYYKNLTAKYPFLRIELGKPEVFLTDICMLIAYAKSSMIQEAVLCKRPVIECVESSTFSPNASVIEKGAGMAVSCCETNELEKLVAENLLVDGKEQSLRWQLCLSEFGFNLDKNNIYQNVLLKCFY
jgi:hypothetical protein